jgi:hypothetical protein
LFGSDDYFDPPTETTCEPWSESLLLGDFGENDSFNLQYSISAESNIGFDVGSTSISPFSVSGTIGSVPIPTPEPSTLFLLGVGLVGLCLLRKRVDG